MKIRLRTCWMLLLIISAFGWTSEAISACDGSTMNGGGYCVFEGDMSTLGGPVVGAQYSVVASNMYPYQQTATGADLHANYIAAIAQYGNGYQYRQSLLLFDAFDVNNPPANPTPRQKMTLNPKLNYETAGLLGNLSAIENSLITARDTFVYDHYIHYQPLDGSIPKDRLMNTLKLLANIYLMIGDEFLIDALEFRFSSTTLGMELKLQEQIDLLEKARTYYQKAINTFSYGFSPAVGTNVYMSDYFDETVFGLFHLAVERMSMALREKSAKQLAKLISPDPQAEITARKTAGDTLKETYQSTYLMAAATAQSTGGNFLNYGGKRLVNALNTLRNQGNIFRGNLNPLGYDDRYIPMQDFTKLYGDAMNWKNAAADSQATLNTAKRDFDADVDKMKSAISALAENPGGYKTQLASLSGINMSDTDFLNKVSVAGDDLYDCPFDMADFQACIQNKTKGILGSKYYQIREAELNIQRALKKKQNYLDLVEAENKKHNEMLEIEKSYNTAYRDTLKNYLAQMKNARTIEKTKTKVKGKTTVTATVTSYYVSNPQLDLEVQKEIALQEALTNYRIAQMNLTDEITIMNYLNNIAETEIEIGLTIQAMNSSIVDFDNAMMERDNLVYVYQKAKDQVQYTIDLIKERIPEVRILRSEAALNLARNLNGAVHYAYLAAKALEYKYMKPLVNAAVLNEILNIHDLYKMQTVEDVTSFLNKLNAYDICPWGSVSQTMISISLVKDILGLTDRYLNPNNTLDAAGCNPYSGSSRCPGASCRSRCCIPGRPPAGACSPPARPLFSRSRSPCPCSVAARKTRPAPRWSRVPSAGK